MKDKDQFKKPKARHTREDLFDQSKDLLRTTKESLDNKLQEQPKTHSLTILPSYIEKMRNIVHFKKVNGNPYYTQGQLLQEALDLFFQRLETEIPDRPKEVKRAEQRRTGRRKKFTPNNNQNPGNSLFD